MSKILFFYIKTHEVFHLIHLYSSLRAIFLLFIGNIFDYAYYNGMEQTEEIEARWIVDLT